MINLAKACRLAWLEIRGSRSFSTFFVLNLSLGLCGFLALETLRTSIDTYFDERAKAILGGDVEIEVDNRMFTDEDLSQINAQMPAGTVTREERHFYTMMVSDTSSRLVEIIAIDQQFPFYPSMTLQNGGAVERGGASPLVERPLVWIFPELARQLEVDIGDTVRVNDKAFQVADLVIDDAALSGIGLATAPKVYLGIPQLASAQAFQLGSRFEDARYFDLPAGTDLQALEDAIDKSVSATDLDVDLYTEESGRTGRFWDRLGDYLTLISLVALFLAGVGVTYLFRGYLEQRLTNIAVLRSLGASTGLVQATYLILLSSLAVAATLGATVFAMVARPAFPYIFGGLLPEQIDFTFPLRSFALTLLIAVGTSTLVGWPLLRRLQALRPAALFQESGGLGTLRLDFKTLISFTPAIGFYWLISCWQASLAIGSAFVGIFFVAGTCLLGLGVLIRRLSPHEDQVVKQALRLALLNLYRHRLATMMSFAAIGLGVMLTTIIPQIETVLRTELTTGQQGKYPSMFMIDIQEEQLSGLRDVMQDMGVSFQELAPMIRGRLVKVNGQSITDKLDAEGVDGGWRRRRLTRVLNLTFGNDLRSSETIVAGEPFTPQESPERWPVSFTKEFADGAGLQLGDKLEFEVAGLTIPAEIINLREIDWASFHPNFFVRFGDGPLDAAPKTYVATIPAIEMEQRLNLQDRVVKAFPNISAVDISRAIDRVLGIANTIAMALGFMALLCMLAGLGVLVSIARFNADHRKVQVALLKTLGGGFRTIRNSTMLEFGLLGFAAAFCGSVFSVGAAYLLCYLMFDDLWVFHYQAPLLMMILTPILCVLVGAWANGKALKSKPASLLAES